MGLCLEAVEVQGAARWRWILTDEESGIFLAEHHVQLDESAWEYRALADLYGYLRWHAAPDPDGRPPSEGMLLAEVGAWVGREVLGPAIGREIAAAAAPVRIVVPAEAGFLLSWPLDLAHVDGVPLAERDEIGFVFALPGFGHGRLGRRQARSRDGTADAGRLQRAGPGLGTGAAAGAVRTDTADPRHQRPPGPADRAARAAVRGDPSAPPRGHR